ncbi:hypothetical protein KIH74_15170 [Kineosporia sp. J2-2]|uniref:Uncharacterized protein n=1 Tax=Kineosporia corallincola TaxID=2835133 RepID=A0ABS5TGQ3_9ACTN|nr:hypothetical protein [Kineosporia corallincola]MBT0770281.1 hypothetical protein [Kineosporia corallincola]
MREIEHPEGGRWLRSSVVDDEAVDHERQIGAVVVTGDVVRVRVAQRVDFDLLASPVVTRPWPPRITVGEMFEMNAAQARELAEQLWDAAVVADEVDGRRPPGAAIRTSVASIVRDGMQPGSPVAAAHPEHE